MSDSFDTSNELEKFDEWEKNTSSIDDLSLDSDLNFAESLDLPDFDENLDFGDTDFDIFADDQNTENEITANSDDTTLTTDELSNLTNGVESITEETVEAADSNIDDFDIPDFESISQVLDEPLTENDTVEVESSEVSEDFSFDTISDEIISDDFASLETENNSEDIIEETPSVEESIPDTFELDDSLSSDDFNLDEPVESVETPVEENIEDNFAQLSEDAPVTEEVSFDEMMSDSHGEEEISLDDFMEEGFSDESVASGNNGFEAGKEPQDASASEEISLDDFFDGEFSMDEPQQEETVVDEKPLDMDINFDPSADTIETEVNNSVDLDFDDDDYETEPTEEKEEENEIITTSSSDSFDSEEIDLSDFGIDENAEETPVTQDVEGQKNKETVVDYDLSVQNEVASSAPLVNEVKTADSTENNAVPENIVTPVPETSNPNVSVVDSSILQKLVDELSSMKAEINSLKSQFAEQQKEIENEVITSDVPSIDDTQIETESSGGFFSSDDGDDTIALSTDELSNIMNNADFTEETISENVITPEEDIITSEEEVVIPEEEVIEETFVPEEEVKDESADATILETSAIATAGLGLAAAASEFDISANDDTVLVDEPLIENESVTDEENVIEDDTVISEDEPVIEETIVSDNEPVFDDETIAVESEPVIEETIVSEEIPVEETVTEVAIEEEPVMEETSVDLEIEDDGFASVDEDFSFDSVEDDYENIIETDNNQQTEETISVSEPTEEFSLDAINTEDSVINTEDSAINTETFEFDTETVTEEPVIENSDIEQTIDFDTAENDTIFDTSDEELDNISFEDTDETSIDDDLPEEISIPKDETFYEEEVPTVSSIIADSETSNDISEETIVEEESPVFEDVFENNETVPGIITEEDTDDFQFDSIIDSVEQSENLEPTTLADETISEEVLDDQVNILDEEPVIIENEPFTFEEQAVEVEEPVIDASESITEETSFVEETSDDTIAADNTVVLDETITADETVISDETPIFDDDFLTDEDNNDLSDSNLDYLTTEETPVDSVSPLTAPVTPAPAEDTPADNSAELKEDIKSVLRYMDQLLENLPEEKIIEFAKSKEYATYQKLFSELGLL